VFGHALVFGDAIVGGQARISGTAVILGGYWGSTTVTEGTWKAPGWRT
jgi:hypothetical protein